MSIYNNAVYDRRISSTSILPWSASWPFLTLTDWYACLAVCRRFSENIEPNMKGRASPREATLLAETSLFTNILAAQKMLLVVFLLIPVLFAILASEVKLYEKLIVTQFSFSATEKATEWRFLMWCLSATFFYQLHHLPPCSF